ncbi:MAG TPA: T9SS type A sorting domain-containing protein [Bacteroidota bacterium]|nr:T9SS type A sorting domain-containing protein [Bacteroidota bacterium]
MRRLVTILVFVLIISLTLFAQVPNAGFEAWTNGSPDGWFTSNTPPTLINITKSSVTHSGSGSARGDAVKISGTSVVAPALLQVGTSGMGFTYTQRPASFTGWYQFVPAAGSGDQLVINVYLFKGLSNGLPVGAASTSITTAATSFKQFSLSFFYFSSDTPDTCLIQFDLAGAAGQPTAGSYFLVDDLSLGSAATDVQSTPLPVAFALNQNYPNPFNPSTSVSFQLPVAADVRLSIFDMLGREVETLIEGRQEAGRHAVQWNASNLPSGMYIYRLTATSEKGEIFRDTRKAMLLK